jgi:hypothetical protein
MQYADNRTSGRITANTAVGYQSLMGSTTAANNTGQNNTSVGYRAMMSNTSGHDNVGLGKEVLYNNTTGGNNISIGTTTLYSNTSGSSNVAIGDAALYNNTSAIGNTSVGTGSMFHNTTGYQNTAYGLVSLINNTTGIHNTAIGYAASGGNISAEQNVSLGFFALNLNSTGSYNTALGSEAGITNSTGANNIFIGKGADVTSGNLSHATVIGVGATVSTSNTMVFGAQTNTTKWAFGRPTTSYALQVGNTTSDGNGAYLSTGGTWTNGSSRDFKEDFEELNGEEILNKIDKLSVTKWKYKGTNETHIGPIAEEFKEQFNLGVKEDDKHISTIDASGIALKAIQMLRKENIELKERLKLLEEVVQKLISDKK